MKCPGTHPRWSRFCLCQTIPFATAQVHAKSADSFLFQWATQWRAPYHCSPLPPKKRGAKPRAPPCPTHRELPGRNKGRFSVHGLRTGSPCHTAYPRLQRNGGKTQRPTLRNPPRAPGRNKGAFLRPWATRWKPLPHCIPTPPKKRRQNPEAHPAQPTESSRKKQGGVSPSVGYALEAPATLHTHASKETAAKPRGPPCATHRELPGGNKDAECTSVIENNRNSDLTCSHDENTSIGFRWNDYGR